MKTSKIRSVVVTSSAAVLLAAAGQAIANVDVTHVPIALSGTDGVLGPNQGAGVTFTGIDGQPAVNNSRQVAFRAVSSSGALQGLWLHTAGTNNNTVLTGAAQPGGGTYTGGFNTPQVNNAGQTAFRLGASSGVFSDTGSGTGRVMLTGDFAPGTTTSGPLAKYSSVASGMPFFNSAGQVAYIGNLAVDATLVPPTTTASGVVNTAGIWIGTSGTAPTNGNAVLAVRQNDVLTNIPDSLGNNDPSGNTRLGSLSNSLGMSFNGGGKFVMNFGLQGSNVTTGNGVGGNSTMIASNRSGTFAAIARANNFAPDAAGAPSANRYRSFTTSQIGFNDAGRVAFQATLKDNAGVQVGSGALYSDVNTGTLREIARSGNAMPAVYASTDKNATTPLSSYSGNTWGGGYSNLTINGNDQLVFSASSLGNTGGLGTTAMLSMNSAGKFFQIMREGDVAVANDPLSTNGSDTRFSNVSSVAQNALGQVAFTVSLTNPGGGVSVGLGNGSSLWATDYDGTLVMVARTGTSMFVGLTGPGDFRTLNQINGIVGSGGQDGRVISFNDNGDLAVQLGFTDNSSGIFLFHIPAPGAAGLLGLGGLLLARRRR